MAENEPKGWKQIPEVTTALANAMVALQTAGFDTSLEQNVFIEGGSLTWVAKDRRWPSSKRKGRD